MLRISECNVEVRRGNSSCCFEYPGPWLIIPDKYGVLWAKATEKNPSYGLWLGTMSSSLRSSLFHHQCLQCRFLRNEVLLVKMSLNFFIHFTKKRRKKLNGSFKVTTELMLYVFLYLYCNRKEYKLWNKLRCGFTSATYYNGPWGRTEIITSLSHLWRQLAGKWQMSWAHRLCVG